MPLNGHAANMITANFNKFNLMIEYFIFTMQNYCDL